MNRRFDFSKFNSKLTSIEVVNLGNLLCMSARLFICKVTICHNRKMGLYHLCFQLISFWQWLNLMRLRGTTFERYNEQRYCCRLKDKR
jgi:hypothetical protein